MYGFVEVFACLVKRKRMHAGETVGLPLVSALAATRGDGGGEPAAAAGVLFRGQSRRRWVCVGVAV